MDNSGKTLQCVVVTPERAVLDEPADFVALPMYDGELGVLPGRAPLIGRLGYGELRLQQRRHDRRYYVDGGFAQVRADVVTVLTQKATPVADLNAEEARQQLSAATQMPGSSPEKLAAREHAEQRARGQLRARRACRGALIALPHSLDVALLFEPGASATGVLRRTSGRCALRFQHGTSQQATGPRRRRLAPALRRTDPRRPRHHRRRRSSASSAPRSIPEPADRRRRHADPDRDVPSTGWSTSRAATSAPTTTRPAGRWPSTSCRTSNSASTPSAGSTRTAKGCCC